MMKSAIGTRLLCAVTGVVAIITGLHFTALAIYRLLHPAPAPVPIPRILSVVLTLSFIVSIALSGLCWLLLALSDRVWNSTS